MKSPAPIRAFLFDMDGVLVDSNPLHRITWAAYNRQHGIETTNEMQERMYGKRNDEIVRDFFGEGLSEEEVNRHGAAKEALYRRMLQPRMGSALVPGVREFLERYRHIPAAVATNAERANVDLVLREAGLGQYFQVVLDGSRVSQPKPYPDIYLRAAEELGVPPEFCVVFEDSRTGVRAGLAAGMRVVGVTTTHDDLEGTSLLIPDFQHPALENWLQPSVCSAAEPA